MGLGRGEAVGLGVGAGEGVGLGVADGVGVGDAVGIGDAVGLGAGPPIRPTTPGGWPPSLGMTDVLPPPLQAAIAIIATASRPMRPFDDRNDKTTSRKADGTITWTLAGARRSP